MAMTEPGLRTSVTVDGRCLERLVIRTRWLVPGDDLADVLLEYSSERRPGDTIIISEKVALLLTGRVVPTESIRVGWLARLLARCVRRGQGSLGISVPSKMQYVLGVVGVPRMVGAAAASAITRPFGIRGVFYRIAGSIARDIDGGRPPYEDTLFPPFDAHDAHNLCEELAAKLSVGVAIVDINDFGGSIRAVSRDALPSDLLWRALADNPLRQRLCSTPFGLVRPT